MIPEINSNQDQNDSLRDLSALEFCGSKCGVWFTTTSICTSLPLYMKYEI